jgi:fused-like protein
LIDIPILNVQQILQNFETNIKDNPIVSLTAINLIAEILQHDQTMSLQIVHYFEKPQAYRILNELINPTKRYTSISSYY